MTPRIDIDPARLDAAQRAIHDRILNGPRGVVEGPLKVWLASPDLAGHAEALGAFCRYGTSLAPRLSELAILVTGAYWQAGFEWAVHAPIATRAGLDAPIVEDIRRRRTPRFVAPDEAAVHGFCRELLDEHAVGDETYRRAVDVLSERGVVELVGILGYYGFIAMTIRAFRVANPAGAADPFE